MDFLIFALLLWIIISSETSPTLRYVREIRDLLQKQEDERQEKEKQALDKTKHHNLYFCPSRYRDAAVKLMQEGDAND